MNCPPGQHPNSDFTACVLCPEGTYKPDAGLGMCSNCTKNKTTAEPGAIDRKQCKSTLSVSCTYCREIHRYYNPNGYYRTRIFSSILFSMRNVFQNASFTCSSIRYLGNFAKVKRFCCKLIPFYHCTSVAHFKSPVKLISAFIFTYSKSRFSHKEAHLLVLLIK